MINNWSKSSNNYRIAEVSQQMDKLPVAVYKYQLDMFEQPYLAEIGSHFEMPGKIYETERPFIERVKKSWAHTHGNMGILLNGVKGTGKSITAKVIANEMQLPVIIIPFKHKTLVSFLNEIQQDIIVFIDEYDKIFDRHDNSLLSVMDGVLKTDYRVMFLLTSNDIWLDRNMLQRPSRIRYVKSYTDMTLDQIMEIVDDLLEHKHLKDETIKFISRLGIITMDLVKSIVQEVNIHNEEPSKFADVFNISNGDETRYEVYKVVDGQKELCRTKVTISPQAPFTKDLIECDFYINGNEMGEIIQVNSETEIVVEDYIKDDNNEWQSVINTYIVDDGSRTHRAFINYVF